MPKDKGLAGMSNTDFLGWLKPASPGGNARGGFDRWPSVMGSEHVYQGFRRTK
jgi:hypothetical protein